MKRYEGLFILNIAGREEGVKDVIDRISDEISKAGGKVETVQKMDKRAYARVADNKHTTGFYVNIIFEGEPNLVADLHARFSNDEDVFRMLCTLATSASGVPVGAGAVPT